MEQTAQQRMVIYESFTVNFLTCFISACVATSTSTDDGTTGNFYCINGGTVGGKTGNCTCMSCNTGYGGVNCSTADCNFNKVLRLFF